MARSYLNVKLDAGLRRIYCNYLYDLFGLYIVNEYPKSGGTWLSQMLAEYMGIPFQKNQFPTIGKQVMHGHYYTLRHNKRIICVLRDGRDVMVSFYYHSMFPNGKDNEHLVRQTRRELQINNPENIRENLPLFIDYIFTKGKHPRFHWDDFVMTWQNMHVPMIKYESLLGDTVGTMHNLLTLLGVPLNIERINEVVEKYSFKKLTGREPGVEQKNNFLRKGIAGDWLEKFSPEARLTFYKYAGKALITAGYEIDDSWVYQEMIKAI